MLANSTMVTIGNLSPGLEYMISVFTKLHTGGRSPTSVLYISSPSLITGNQGNPTTVMYMNTLEYSHLVIAMYTYTCVSAMLITCG